MNDAIELALKTWYAVDHPLHLNPRHPAIKLAGEAGEILDLYGKHECKPGFDWWNCKLCKKSKSEHQNTSQYCYHWSDRKPNNNDRYTPFVLDELGDFTYYLRILCYIHKIPLQSIQSENYHYWGIDKILAIMAQNSCVILNDWLDREKIDVSRLKVIWGCLIALFGKLGVTWDEVIELNAIKLIDDPNHNGWENADVK